MKTKRKILTTISLVSLIVSVLMLIGAIFGVPVFKGVLLKVLLTFATLAVGCAFATKALSIYRRNRVVSLISLSLIILSVVLALIVYWAGFDMSVGFNKFLLILAMMTILFNIIVSLIIKLDRRYVALQVITYGLVLVIDIVITLQILNVDIFAIKHFWKFFLAICLVAFGLLCTTSILGRKYDGGEKESKEKQSFVKISQSEYDDMKAKIKALEEENNTLKQQLNK